MAFKKHDPVYSKKLEEAGVVLEVLKSGAYKVGIGKLCIECREEDLAPLASWQLRRAKPQPSGKSRQSKGPARSRSVDLHGMRQDEALFLVERTINEAILAHLDSVEIVHGVGTGRLKAAVHRYLATLPVVKRYRLDERNPGATWAYF